ncbi:MFS transporter [Cronbergia sp. UHCC 0137]|uniref:MFS transporter n=1 Tax=Cronbergia sp. UHCC 0137 TaxID=3110239 RepID=UPI002B205244|nr:MFS transporter [Cronbergia sp. UHCC 0137]MEA5619897.1 MFS transporter [Cronbergia sp. UHCC 0137]
MKAFNNFNADLRRNLLLLFTAGLLFWSSLGSLLPTLPLYIEAIGATKQQIGIVMGSFAIGMLLLRPFCGNLADQKGRKIVLLMGMSVAAIAPLGYLVVDSIVPLMVIRAFHGISIAAFATAFIALVGDLAPEHRRGEIIGYMSLVNPLGVALGPALGGFIQEGAGYNSLFLTSAALGGTGLLCVFMINSPIKEQPTNANTDNDNFLQLLISPRVRVPALVLLLFGLVLGTSHTFIALFIKTTGVDLNPGLFFTATAVASFSVRLVTGRASDKYGRGLFVTTSLIAYTLALVCIWQANNAFTFLLGGFLEGAASGTVIPMISVMMTDRALPHERGRIFGVSLIGLDIGLAIAGPVLGAVAEQVGYRSMYGLSTGLTLLAILIFITQSSRNLPESLRFALGRGADIYALK